MNAFILMFDLTSRSSFFAISKYADQMQNLTLNPDLFIAVCGNKCDLNKSEYKVTGLEIHSFMCKLRNMGFICDYFDISAKTYYNIERPFQEITKHVTYRSDITFRFQPKARGSTIY
jgi:GTPase SAR1 family protein